MKRKSVRGQHLTMVEPTATRCVLYIAGPFRAANAWLVEQNVRRAEEAALRAAELGWVPLCPHSMTRFFDGTLTDEYWLAATLELLRRCDAILMLPGWQGSAGARAEHAEAVRLGVKVLFALPVHQETGLMGCGHPPSDVVSGDEGTCYCAGCERDARAKEVEPPC